MHETRGPLQGRRARVLGVVAVVLTIAAACNPKAGPTSTPSKTGESSSAIHDTKWPIEHVVFVIKENRSFDTMYGQFPGANGVTTGKMYVWSEKIAKRAGVPLSKVGKVIRKPLVPPPGPRYSTDLPHDYVQWQYDYREGRMDGFAVNPIVAASGAAYTQQRPEDIPNYWRWAEEYVLGDNFFASASGPSFPNHIMSIAATSGGTHDNPDQKFSQIREMQSRGLAKTWGCDIPSSGAVPIYDSEGKVIKDVKPCFNFETEGDLLRKKDIPWAYYAATPEQNGYIWSAYAAIGRYRNDPGFWKTYVKPVDSFEADARAGDLPPVTWVTPQFAYSDHPEFSLCYGENWTTDVVNAVMESPDWEHTAVFITWDDWGGFYDHAKPKQVDEFGFGFRVPLLVISPYAKQGFVDHTRSEFSSVLRFIEDNWSLRQLTARDRAADDLSQAFDFSQNPRPPMTLSKQQCEGGPFDHATPPPKAGA